MQLQVECSNAVGKQQICQICNRSFKMQAAQVMVCDDQGDSYGNVCPECIHRGFGWLNSRFEQFSKLKTASAAVSSSTAVNQD